MPYMVQKNKTLNFNQVKTKIMEQEIDTNTLGIEIVAKLKTIYDPEIPVDIYELGLIYDVMVSTDYEVKILMTLTSPNCPVAESLPREVEEKVKSIEHVKDAEVEITFDPPWSKDLMSEEAKLELGML
jgi:FeS assembly SUF system protein